MGATWDISAMSLEDWAKVHEAMIHTMAMPSEPLRHGTYARFREYTLLLEWNGWYFIERMDGSVAMGSEFYRKLPNGKRGLFKYVDEFEDGKQIGYLYRCVDEEAT